MATQLDKKMRATAERLITKFGKAAQYTQHSDGAYDPSTGAVSSAGPDSHNVTIAPPAGYDEHFVDGDSVQSSDLKTSLSASMISFEPAVRDELTVDGKRYTILHVNPLYSGEQVALYELQLRR